MWVLIYIKREILGNPDPQPLWYQASYAFFFVAFSAAILFAILAYFLSSNARAGRSRSGIRPDAYGMFLVHYPIVLWLNYWLFYPDLPAVVKAAIVFVLSVALSWALTRALRQIPGAGRVL